MKLEDLKPAPRNPRRISAEAMGALGHSLDAFGDLSSICWNRRSGHLVAGHQRMTALKAKVEARVWKVAIPRHLETVQLALA